jgi:aryl-alcohol dehydrogenase
VLFSTVVLGHNRRFRSDRMRISAAICRQEGAPLSIEPVDLDEPKPDEVLVRVIACGICHTDIGVQHMMPKPVVLGHEGSGVVERVGGNVAKVRAGDAVVMTFGSCGYCPSCHEGEPAYCHNMRRYQFAGKRIDGSPTLRQNGNVIHGAFFQQSSFATYALATERNVVKVDPAAAPLELLGPLGCGIQTGAGAVMNTLGVRSGARFAVFGAGSVGLSAVMAARVVGATTIIAVDVNPARLAVALDLGATHTIDARNEDATARIRAITGDGANFSLETSAVEASFSAAIDCLTMRGVCGIVTVPKRGETFPFSPVSILLGRRLVGVLEGSSVPDRFIPRLIELYRQGRFPMDRLATYYPFADINRAIKDSHHGLSIKPIVRMA